MASNPQNERLIDQNTINDAPIGHDLDNDTTTGHGVESPLLGQPENYPTSNTSTILGFHISHVFLSCLLLYFLVEMYDMITIAPLVALFEQSICRSYYEIHDPSSIRPGGSVAEHLCKIDSIQEELAIVRGWKLAFDTIPGQSCTLDVCTFN